MVYIFRGWFKRVFTTNNRICIRIHGHIFLVILLIIRYHWSRWQFCIKQTTNHYLNKWLSKFNYTDICFGPQCAKYINHLVYSLWLLLFDESNNWYLIVSTLANINFKQFIGLHPGSTTILYSIFHAGRLLESSLQGNRWMYRQIAQNTLVWGRKCWNHMLLTNSKLTRSKEPQQKIWLKSIMAWSQLTITSCCPPVCY